MAKYHNFETTEMKFERQIKQLRVDNESLQEQVEMLQDHVGSLQDRLAELFSEVKGLSGVTSKNWWNLSKDMHSSNEKIEDEIRDLKKVTRGLRLKAKIHKARLKIHRDIDTELNKAIQKIASRLDKTT